MKKKAFTLLELLVVIAIMAVLAALIFPAFSNMREKGRQAHCANNLKELHTATMNYVSSRGRYPYATTYKVKEDDNFWYERTGWVGPSRKMPPDTGGTVSQMDMWDDTKSSTKRYGTACITNGTLYSYVTDLGVYLCPTFKIEAKKLNPNYEPVRSYVMNWTMNDCNIFGLKDGTKRMLFTEVNTARVVDKITVTANCVNDLTANFLSDNNTTGPRFYRPLVTDGMLYCPSNQITETIAAYHKGRGHVMFADGHIEFLYYSNTWQTAHANW